jgi:serine phosphatase RsbU (regulator of sigma subunit)
MRCAFSWATRPVTANGRDPHAENVAGGDIACAVVVPGGVRLLIGDVMGHDPRAAQTAAEVARAFRKVAVHQDPLQVVAARLDAFVASHADGEEFVTAQFVSVPNGDNGEAQIVCCGHPPPLLLRGGQVTLLDALPPSPPLGLLDLGGYSPRADLLGACPGDSVLLYTDGVSEAHDDRGRPYPLAERAAALSARTPRSRADEHGPGGCASLPELLRDDLLDHVGGRLRDDATLLYLRFAERLTPAVTRAHCALLITFSSHVLPPPQMAAARPGATIAERHPSLGAGGYLP